MLIIAGMTAMALAGCQRQDEVTVSEPAPVPVPEPAYVVADLALALPDISPSPASTRMASEVVQDGSSRDVTILSITPFEKQGTILSADKASYVDGFSNDQQYVDKDKDNDGNFTRKYHYFEAMSFQRGVASMLTYAKAKPESAPSGATTKSYNGSLMTMVDGEKKFNEVAGEYYYYIPRFITPGSLTFDLEPIYDIEHDGTPPQALAIANYLTTIANSKVPDGEEPSAEELRWKDTDGVLKGLYNGFINMGNDARPGLIAGSAANVIPFVNALFEDIDETLASENISLTDMQRQLCQEIKTNILAGAWLPTGEGGFTVDNNKVTSLGLDYPGELGLPDGAAVLLWDTEEQKFGVVTQTTSTSNITGMGRYAYPPELYYYGNSRIKTSNNEVEKTNYQTETTWTDVLNLYENDDAKVSGDTKAVAIKDPLQYGVGRLQARVNPVGNVLPDSNLDNIPVVNDNKPSFPITGIIISGQFPVGYDFTVIGDNTTTAIANDNESGDNSIEHFVYDRHVLNNQGEKIYLSATEQTAEFNTLSLQTKTYSQEKPEESDVTVILEFENKSGQDFRGENKMIVYQGTKFYLVGKLKLTPPQAGDEDYKKRIFTQDHTTEVTMTINSLARAYNVMPNILSGRLEVSVEMKLKWTEATPTTVILK